jgi:hypothetical protein
MNFTLDPSLTSTMRTWIQSALDLCSYPLKDVDIDVTFVKVAEPSTPGHQDTMGTTETGTVATIEIRDGLDDPTHPMNAGLPNPTQDTRFFFMETVIHEMGHVVSFHFIDNDTKRGVAAAAFTKTGETGEGLKTGTLADWNPLDSAWEDRIQEAVAEVFKDTYLADSFRIYENRTHWDVSSGAFNALMTMLLANTSAQGFSFSGGQARESNAEIGGNGSWKDFVLEYGEPPASRATNNDGVFLNALIDSPFRAWAGPPGSFVTQPMVVLNALTRAAPYQAQHFPQGKVSFTVDFGMHPDFSKAWAGDDTNVLDAPFNDWGGPFADNPYDITGGPFLRVFWRVVGQTLPHLTDAPYLQTFNGVTGSGEMPLPPDDGFEIELVGQIVNGGVQIGYYAHNTDSSMDFYDYVRPGLPLSGGTTGQPVFEEWTITAEHYLGPGGPGVQDAWAAGMWHVEATGVHTSADVPDYPYQDPEVNIGVEPGGIFRFQKYGT